MPHADPATMFQLPWKHRLPMSPSTKFGSRFLLACLLLFTILELMPDPFYYPLNRLNTILASRLLLMMGLAPSVSGLIIVVEGFSAKVIGECSAVFISVLPLAFIFAYPSSWRGKLIGWTTGLSLLFGINLVRIALLVYTGARAPDKFELTHLYLGQTAMVLAVLGICLGWVQWLQRKPAEGDLRVLIGRSLAVSVVAFLIWLLISEPYSRMLYMILYGAMAVVDVNVQIPAQLNIYPDTFQCFNWVTFSTLFWSAGFRHLNQRLRQWLAGLSILAFFHLLFKFLQILFFQLNQHHWMGTINVLLVLNEWLLPFGLWVLFRRKALTQSV